MNLHKLQHAIRLVSMVAEMSDYQKMRTTEIIKECELARLFHGSTITRELAAVRGKYGKGKVGQFLRHLSNCSEDDAMAGIDYLAGNGFK